MKRKSPVAASALIYLHLCQLMAACTPSESRPSPSTRAVASRSDALLPPTNPVVQTDFKTLADGSKRTPGQTPFKTAVTPTGQSSISIPIWVSPARGGFQPQLSFEYRSDSADGHLGIGWSLGGMSAVSRCPRRPDTDGRGVWMSALESNAFCLDGMRLVEVAPNEFRTSPISNVRVLRDTTNDAFTVQGPDGSRRIYGHARRGAHLTYAWLLTEAQDPATNRISYEYGLEGEPTVINYGGSGAGALGNTRRIAFTYERRVRELTPFPDATAPVRLRLTSVEVSAPQGVTEAELPMAPVRKYRLVYRTVERLPGRRDVLLSLQECAVDACKAPVEFEAGGLVADRFEAEETLFDTGYSQVHGLVLADVNGDGRTDVVYQVPQGNLWRWAYRLRGSGSGAHYGAENDLGLPPTSDSSPYPTFLDLDGDGRVDMLGPVPGGSLSGADSYYRVYRGMGGGWFLEQPLSPSYASLLTGRALVGDLDADGLPDIIDLNYWDLGTTSFGYPTLNMHVRWNQSVGGAISFAAPQPWLLETCASAGPIAQTSLDAACLTGGFGSALTTACTQCGAADIARSAVAAPGTTTVAVQAAAQRPARGRFGVNRSGTGGYGLENFVVDLNGDGVVELVYRDAIDDLHEFASSTGGRVTPTVPAGLLSRVVRRARHTGGRNFTKDEVVLLDPAAQPQLINQSVVAELNGDGAPDLLLLGSNGSRIRLNDGLGHWGASTTLARNLPTDDVRVADFDADGISDILDLNNRRILQFAQWTLTPTDQFQSTYLGAVTFGDEPERNLVVGDIDSDTLPDLVMVRGGAVVGWRKSGSRPGLITVVRHQRREEFFEYASLPNADYQPAPTCDQGQFCVKSGMFVVNSHGWSATDSQLGPPVVARNRYAYRDARVDHAAGWLGFGLTSVRHEQTGAVEERSYGVTRSDRAVCTTQNCNGRFTYPYARTPKRVTRCLDLRETPGTVGRQQQSDSFTNLNETWTAVGNTEFARDLLSTQVETTEFEGETSTDICAGVPLSASRLPALRTSREGVDLQKGSPARVSSAKWPGGPTSANPGTTTINTVRTTYYPDDTARWLLGLPKTVTTTSVEGPLTESRTVDYEYRPGTSLVAAEVLMKGMPSGDSDFERRTEYERDPFQNVVRVNISGSGTKRVQEFDYDAAEHAFPTRRRVFSVLPTTASPLLELKAYYAVSLGAIVAVDDANDVRAERKYDGFGRVKLEADGRSPTATYAYLETALANGSVFEVVRTEQLRRAAGISPVWSGTIRLDAFERPVTKSSLGWQGRTTVESMTYDSLGRLATQTLPRFAGDPASTYVFSYDKAGRRTVTSNSDTGDTVRTFFEGLSERTFDARGFQSVVTRDAAGRLSSSTNVDGLRSLTTWYAYGPFNTLRTVTDPMHRSRLMTWDALGRRTSLSDPDSGFEQTHYNAFGEVKRSIDARGAVVDSIYDGVGRVTARTLSPVGSVAPGQMSNTERFEYDISPNGLGKLSRSTSMDGVVTSHTYTTRGLPDTSTWSIPGLGNFAFTSSWDPNGRLSQLQYPDGFKVNYAYDDTGRVTDVFDLTSPLPRLFRVADVDAMGNTTSEEFANGAVTQRSFDRVGRLTFQETTQLGSTQLGQTSAGAFQRLKYEYGLGSVLKARHDPTKQLSEYFEHDFAGRLKEWRVEQNTGSTCRQSLTTYGYDDAGNLLSRTATGGGLNVINRYGPQTGVAGGVNALTSTVEGSAPPTYFSYDAAGNRERVFLGRSPSSPSDLGDKRIEWTHFNLPRRLVDVSGQSTTLSYDAGRQRVLRAGAGEQVLTLGPFEERRVGGVTTQVRSVAAGGRVVAQLSRSGAQNSAVYVHSDQLGSPDAVTTAVAGRAVLSERSKYEPFGERRDADDVAEPRSVPHPRNIGFTGHEPDEFFALTNMGGRIYDQHTGRFMSADPVVSSLSFGQSLNRYSYVLNSPLNFTDPSGFEPVALVVLGIAVTWAALHVAGMILAAGMVLFGAIWSVASSVAGWSFGSPSASGSPDGGASKVDDGQRQDWGDASHFSATGPPIGTVECKGGQCTGTPSEFPKMRFGWPQADPRGQGEFVQLAGALSQHVRRHAESGAVLNDMFDAGAVIDVTLRVPPARMERGPLAGALGDATARYSGWPGVEIRMRGAEYIGPAASRVVVKGVYGEGALKSVGAIPATLETVFLHEVGHGVGAFLNRSWTWDGVGVDGVVGGASPDNPIGSEAIRWENDALRDRGMEERPLNSVHGY